MEEVIVSSKYQVVIPKTVRAAMRLHPGDKIRIFLYDGRIEFVPVRGIRKMRGFLKGMNSDVDRDEDRC